ncbi:MAG: M42 family metallopeptidase [Culicoidibacterales bacterium]
MYNQEFLIETLQQLLKIDSPSGFCAPIMDYIQTLVSQTGYNMEFTNKGALIITVPGKSNERVIGLSAHVDTLGAMVRSITSDGNLKFTLVGGPSVPSLDSEYCRIRTRNGKEYTGTFLSTSPSVHVYEDSKTKARTPENMIIRIDECVKTQEDVKNLGIMNGDFIFIEPKVEVTESGFVKSRFLDDKASVACLLTLLDAWGKENFTPEFTIKVFISTYEEVGHGSSYIPADITEMIAVDMGCIGDDLACTEYDVSICAKDSGGPYDYGMTNELIALANQEKLPYAVDIYPMYGSDVVAALRGGNDIKGALIGPGVHASHGMERTHISALKATLELLQAYIRNQK